MRTQTVGESNPSLDRILCPTWRVLDPLDGLGWSPCIPQEETRDHRPSASLTTDPFKLRPVDRNRHPDGPRAHGEIQEASAPQVINPAGRTRSDLFRRASRRTFCGNAKGRSAADAIPLLPFFSWLQVPLDPSGPSRSGPMHAGRYTCSRFRRVLLYRLTSDFRADRHEECEHPQCHQAGLDGVF